jgi:hypothetical protein
MEILAPGTAVWLSLGEDITGEILQVCIKSNSYVQYQVAWWSGRERRCEWLEAFEFTPVKDAKLPIGFQNGAT